MSQVKQTRQSARGLKTQRRTGVSLLCASAEGAKTNERSSVQQTFVEFYWLDTRACAEDGSGPGPREQSATLGGNLGNLGVIAAGPTKNLIRREDLAA